MSFVRQQRTRVVGALAVGFAFTAFYYGLTFTRALHGMGVKGLGPAINLVWHNLDPHCYERSFCDFEVLAMNVVLYAFWVWVILNFMAAIRSGYVRLRHRRG